MLHAEGRVWTKVECLDGTMPQLNLVVVTRLGVIKMHRKMHICTSFFYSGTIFKDKDLQPREVWRPNNSPPPVFAVHGCPNSNMFVLITVALTFRI